MVADYPAPGAAPVGGPQVAVSRLVPELARRGVEVIVVAPAPGSSRTERYVSADRVDVIRLPAAARFGLIRRLQPWRRGVVSTVESLSPDLVHGQGLLPGGIAVADVNRLPRVVTARGNMQADTLAAYGTLSGPLRASLRNRFARRAAERADVVIGVNPDWTVNIPRRPQRFVYIPNIIGDRFFAMKRAPEPGLVLFTGGSREIKGWTLLVEAWPTVRAAVPEARLLVTGWDGQSPSQHLQGQEDSITVESWVSSEELADRMARASVLVVASKFEVSPIVVAEAWAIGLPVVVPAVGGVGRLVEGAGVVVPRRQPAEFARAIVEALRGGGVVDGFVAEGRRRAEAHRAEAVVRAHVDLYDELLGGR